MLLCDTVSSEAWTNMYLDNETMTDQIKPAIKVHCCDLKSLLELLIGVCMKGCYSSKSNTILRTKIILQHFILFSFSENYYDLKWQTRDLK